MLKEYSNEISPILALIFNESLARGDARDEWRQANVSPVFKKGEKYDAANYTPVSLMCVCCNFKHKNGAELEEPTDDYLNAHSTELTHM